MTDPTLNPPNDSTRPTATADETTAKPTPSWLSVRWPGLGLAGVALWLLLFSVGVLIDSAPNRTRLGSTTSKQPKEQIVQEAAELKLRIWKLENPGKEPPAPDPQTSPQNDQAPKKPTSSWLIIPDFLLAMFAFMPLNLAFLCIVAAFTGGCSVNKDEVALVEAQIHAFKSDDDSALVAGLRQRLSYLTEHPGNSAIRGLVVYLILISGLFVLGTSPVGGGDSNLVDLTQYMRLAGLFSFFGYIAGNDPTVFSSLLNLGSSRLRTQADGQSSKR